MLETTADELGRLKETNETEFDKVMDRANFTAHTFKIRARLESYMDESRLVLLKFLEFSI